MGPKSQALIPPEAELESIFQSPVVIDSGLIASRRGAPE
jgi:hypothetical protein